MQNQDNENLVEVRNLKMYFPVTSGVVFQRKVADVKAVDDVSFDIDKNDSVSIVGESGSGKSTLLRCISRLTDATSGKIYIDGQELLTLKNKELIEL